MALLIISLASCTGTTTGSATTTDSSTTTNVTTSLTTDTQVTTSEITTTSFVYDDRSLVPEDCEHLENIGDYQPVWCDEFDYEGLPDATKWSYVTGGDGFGNGESQYYTSNDLDNASVSDGTLKITALKENYASNEYTSARLVSKYFGDWTYGKIQVRAKLPSGDGTWPAIWMLPTYQVYGGWPYSGEIDIMEHVGSDPGYVYGTIHTGAFNHNLGTQIGYSYAGTDFETAFHVYELEWSPGHMEVFIDGISYGVFGYNPWANPSVSVTDAWPFDQEFHLIMNLAIGGSWGGEIDDSIFPQTLEVDYVRVYQKDYAGLDHEAPSIISNLTLITNSYDSIKVAWDKATDDVEVKEYDVIVDYQYVGSTSVNAFDITGLEPNTIYRIDVLAVDFAGNRSASVSLSTNTDYLPLATSVIQAEDYDNKEGVFLRDCTDGGDGRCVTWISDGDYMEYNLLVEEDATYEISYRISSESEQGVIKLYGKGPLPLATTTLPVTGNFDTFTDVTSSTFSLRAGVYTFKILADTG